MTADCTDAEVQRCDQDAYLAALDDLGIALLTRFDVDALLPDIVARACRLLKTSIGFVSLVEPTDATLKASVTFGVTPDHVYAPFRPGEGVAGTVWQRAEPLVVEDYGRWPGRLHGGERDRIRAAICVPLIAGGEVIGVLGCANTEPGRNFGPQDLVLLTRFGQLATIALEHARVHRALSDELRARKAAEEELRASEKRMSAILDAAVDGIITFDLRGTIIEWNPAAERLFGYPRAAAIGNKVAELIVPPHLLNRHQACMDGFLTTEEQAVTGQRFEFAGKRADGSEFPIEIALSRVLLDGPPLFTASVHDITKRKRGRQQRKAFSVLGQRLSATTTAKDAAQSIADIADDLFGWDAFSLKLYAPESDTLHAVLNVDEVAGHRTEVPATITVASPSPVIRSAMDEGGQLILRDGPPTPTPGLIPFGDTARLSASLMFVPVRRGAQVIGVLSIQSYRANAYTVDDLATLQVLADHCSAALERVRAEDTLRESEARYRYLFEHNPQPLWVYDFETLRFLAVNDAAVARYGYSREEFLAMRIPDLRVESERPDLFAHLQEPDVLDQSRLTKHRMKDGTEIDVEVVSHRAPFDGRAARLVLITDVTERMRSERALRHHALHDALTGLPNRVLFMERLEEALARARRDPTYRFAVIFLDLDRFKVVNDSLGHLFGDELLREVARRFMACAGAADTIARLGGDEFALLLGEAPNVTTATDIAQQAQERLTAPFTIDNQTLVISASIGITLGPGAYHRPDELLRDADTAMYRAKAAGRDRSIVFNATMRAHATARLQMESDLRRAIEKGELILCYQPIVALESRALIGFEALVRWARPGHAIVPPGRFLPVAEETGLIVPIDRWGFRQACAQLRSWIAGHPAAGDLTLAVNVSARNLAEPDFVAWVLATTAETGIDPRQVTLEVTEGTLIEHTDQAAAALGTLHAAGFRIHLDDFGVGYSALGYLKRLPITGLKIDRSFIRGEERTKEYTVADAEIVRAIVALAHNLGMVVTAEGVETEGQRAQLQALGCDWGQGYLFSPPVNPARTGRWLTRSIAYATDGQ